MRQQTDRTPYSRRRATGTHAVALALLLGGLMTAIFSQNTPAAEAAQPQPAATPPMTRVTALVADAAARSRSA